MPPSPVIPINKDFRCKHPNGSQRGFSEVTSETGSSVACISRGHASRGQLFFFGEFLSSVKRNLLQAFSASAPPDSAPVATEAMTRFFFVVVEVDNEESNIKLMESAVRLAETLQLPDGRHIRAS